MVTGIVHKLYIIFVLRRNNFLSSYFSNVIVLWGTQIRSSCHSRVLSSITMSVTSIAASRNYGEFDIGVAFFRIKYPDST